MFFSSRVNVIPLGDVCQSPGGTVQNRTKKSSITGDTSELKSARKRTLVVCIWRMGR